VGWKVENNPIDQINLDLGFLEAMIDLFDRMSITVGEIDIKSNTVASMCFEANHKLESIRKQLDKINNSPAAFSGRR